MRRILPVLVLAALLAPASAQARGGGGSGGFGGGGGHSSGGHYSGGGGGFIFVGGGGGVSPGVIVVVILLVIAWYAFKWWARRSAQMRGLNTTRDRRAHRGDQQARLRAASVEAQVDGLADQDATFGVDELKSRAVDLYRQAQQAWTARDRATLKRILAPAIYAKWDEQLRDYESRGEVNVVQIVAGPEVEMVSVANRTGEANDTVTFRITATLNDFVRRPGGPDGQRRDGSSRPVEYWTLRKDGAGSWMVASIEQAEEGQHHLSDQIEIDTWDQKSVARDAVIDVADRVSPDGIADPLALTNIAWSTDAEAAARDLSVLDARFDASVLEVAVSEFIEQWQINDGSLDFTAVRTPNRTVMRSATIRDVRVRDLVSRDPITFRVAVTADGVYYEVDRRTETVLSGDAHRSREVRFLFTLRLDDVAARSWTTIGASVEPGS